MNNKFWNWVKNDEPDTRTLYLDGVIAEESWYDDDITPALFKSELMSGAGDITIYINSPGGDCVAASQIYTMLKEYKGKVTVKIDGIAASAASVITMAGSQVLMSPTSLMFIHNPFTIAMGDSEEMQKVIAMLDEVKDSIINAYELKTGLSRSKISHLMDSETWLSANKAVDMGFADGILFKDTKEVETTPQNNFMFSRRSFNNALLNKLPKTKMKYPSEPLEKRLNLLLH